MWYLGIDEIIINVFAFYHQHFVNSFSVTLRFEALGQLRVVRRQQHKFEVFPLTYQQ